MTTFDETLDQQIITPKIYKDKTVRMATFLGGPLVAGYLIAENFKVFNEFNKARKTWIYTIIVTVFIFGSVFLIPNAEKMPRVVIPLLYSWIAVYLIQRFQGVQIEAHFAAGGQAYSIWRALGISLIFLAITLIILFILLMLFPQMV